MDETASVISTEPAKERSTDQIRQDIAIKRQEFARTVDRLGERIEETLDWRYQVARHPLLTAVMAAGVGFFVFAKVGRFLNGTSDRADGHGRPTSAKIDGFGELPVSTLGTALGMAAVRAGTILLATKVRDGVLARRAARNGAAPLGPDQRSRGGA